MNERERRREAVEYLAGLAQSIAYEVCWTNEQIVGHYGPALDALRALGVTDDDLSGPTAAGMIAALNRGGQR